MLRLIIDTTDEVAIGPESDIVWATLTGIPEPLWNQLKCAKAVIRRESFMSRELKAFGLTPEEFEELIRQSPTRKIFLDSFFNAYRQRKGKVRWGDKTPMNLIAVPQLLSCYPDAQFIHIFRNPKAVAHSFVRQSFGPDSLSDAARMWYFRTRFIIEQGIPAKNLFSLSYENLLTNPEVILGKLFEFLGVDSDVGSVLSQFHVAEHDGVYAEELKSPLDPSRIDHYTISHDEETQIESICADLMQALGYSCHMIQTVSDASYEQREVRYAQWLHECLQAEPAALAANLLKERRALLPLSSGLVTGSGIAENLNREGEKHFLADDIARAERLFIDALTADAACVDACNNLAVVLWQRGEYEKALSQIGQGLDINPEHCDLLANQLEMVKEIEIYEKVLRESDFESSLSDPDAPLAARFQEGSESLLVAFGGIGGAMGLLPFEFFSVTKDILSSKLFVRDLFQSWYHQGLKGVADGMWATRGLLETMIQQSGAKRVVFIGNSMGGYAAILFGALLGIDEVHAFSPQTFIDVANRSVHHDQRWEEHISIAQRVGNSRYFDLRKALLASQQCQTHFHIHSCTASETDWAHAQHLSDVGPFSIHGYSKGGHDLVRQLRDDGQLQTLLRMALKTNETEDIVKSA